MKKVLIISYYWPPAGGPGSMRVVKFAKYLPQFGWQPIILTVENGEYPYIDPHLDNDLPGDLKVFRTKAWDPFRLYKRLTSKSADEAIPVAILTHTNKSWKERLAGFVRSNFFIPDARIGWLPYAKSEIKKIIRQENADLVFISSPPNSSQRLCPWIKNNFDIPVICDFRDPWTDIRYYALSGRSAITRKIDLYFEKKTLEQMDAGITVSQDLVEMFSKKSPTAVSSKFSIIENGFDESDFENCVQNKIKYFEIIHTGNLQEHQNPLALITALKKLKKDYADIYKNFKLKFIGRIHPSLEKLIHSEKIDDILLIEKFKPHTEIPQLLTDAALLLMVVPKIEKNLGIVTGKLFEYLGSGTPILIVGPPKGDAGSIIGKIPNCNIFDYSENGLILDYLLEAYFLWQNDKFIVPANKQIQKYSRRFLSKNLAEIFNKIQK